MTKALSVNVHRGGSAMFYANLFDLMGDEHVVTVDVTKMHELSHPRIEFLNGGSVDEPIMRRMRCAAQNAGGPTIVILDSNHSQHHVAAELEAYAPLVTSGSLLLVQDGIIDTLPLLKADRPGPLPAIKAFLAKYPEFRVDQRMNDRFLISHHPSGWLRRR